MSLARSYAQALLEAARPSELADVRAALEALVKAMDSSADLRVSLCSPVTSTQDKVSVVQKLAEKMKFPGVLTKFLQVVARKGRAAQLPAILETLESVRLEREGGVLGELASADDLSESDVTELEAAFTKKLGKTVEFRVKRDPSLLAGLKVTVGGVTYDGSLRAHLNRLEQELSQGGLTQ